jgi:serine/threonine protein kinase
MSMNNRVGQILGHYRLMSLLGQGGFAEVYLGKHLHLGTQAAVKVLDGKLTTQDVQAFTKEAQTIAKLRHQHILRILDFGFDASTPFLVMEYAPQGTLRDRHPRGSLLPPLTVMSYVKPIAAALHYAHDQGIIHRDVKPENILIDDQQTLLLSDFGIATMVHSTASRKTLEVIGTPRYMAPEQFHGKPCPQSDQYALAITVYEWLTGQCPFHGDSLVAIGMQHLSVPAPSLREKNPAITPAVEQETALIRYDLVRGKREVLMPDAGADLRFCCWGNTDESVVIIPDRNHGKVWYVDVSKTPVDAHLIADMSLLPSIPDCTTRLTSDRLFPLLVGSDTTITILDQ